MTTIRGLAGTASILVAVWCLTPAAQESEIDVVRELLLRFEQIEQRLNALEQKYQSAEDDVGGNDREMQLKEIWYQLSRTREFMEKNAIAFHVYLNDTRVAKSSIPRPITSGGDGRQVVFIEGLGLTPQDCSDIKFIVQNEVANILRFDLDVNATTIGGNKVVLVAGWERELLAGDFKEISVAPFFCDAWARAGKQG